ncbi:DUF2180 family protein [Methanosalsum natronophilum]|uniref:DUF2180 family protein n=1 Tax=Methanosalsum natronophilum TaxID=768733 RepID=UPI0021672953|nr:DUF2180 family protein [Methanosalsum natronophilum]MCS3923459.1 hypothetical protein [Methanosalsum natronophilum]
MKCYDCAKNGKEADTSGICIVCGRGVCSSHLIREEIPIIDMKQYSVHLEGKDLDHINKILCNSCHEAIMENVCEVRQ